MIPCIMIYKVIVYGINFIFKFVKFLFLSQKNTCTFLFYYTFSEQEIDEDDFILLTEDNFKEMEIKIGPRKKILKLIEILKSKSKVDVSHNSNDLTMPSDKNGEIEIEEFEVGEPGPGPSSLGNLSDVNNENETQDNGQDNITNRVARSKFRLNNVICRYSCKKTLKPILRKKNAILAEKLEKNEELTTRELRLFKQIVVDDLIITCKNDYYPTALEKENCAKAIIYNFPSLANSLSSNLPSHVSIDNCQHLYLKNV